MNISIFKPKHALLQKYISSYFFLEQSETEISDFLIFPSLSPNFSFSINTSTEVINNNRVITKQSKPNSVESFLIADNSKPMHYTYSGKIYELSISFKPLGINAFLPKDLNYYVNKGYVSHFPYDDIQKTLMRILKIPNKEEAIDALETYLISIYKPFKHVFLVHVVEDFFETKGNFNIAAITKKHQLSRQTLNTYFKKYICRSAVESKRIIRFRCASENFFQDTITELTYDVHYFDQSHLIKDFKAFTGLTPKQFFAQIYTTADSHIMWI
ncbi:helix-turn-helix domain-containing protein [Flavobacterium sp.]|jgi:AraC-like DNA-binding protein|uniref:helix-turn-helix domain-containing protein n=1 Tax=Flavobacterium sp. TaxID=239 RepID=UPI0037C0D526